MSAKLKTFTQLIHSIDEEIKERKTEIKWYKFRLRRMMYPSITPH
jgi:hypothetical protein